MDLANSEASALRSDYDQLTAFHDVRDASSAALRLSGNWPAAVGPLGAVTFEGLNAPDVALAIAFGLDDAAHTTFSREWLQGRTEPFELAVGDLFPVQDMPLALDRYSSRPDRLGVRDGDLPHVRRRTPGHERIVVDPRFADEVDGLLSGDEVRVAVILPNADIGDFDFVPFPVVPHEPEAQAARVIAAVRRAIDEGCRVIVAPECAVPQRCVDELCEIVAQAAPQPIVFAGSSHLEVAGAKMNLAPVLLGELTAPAWTHRKMSRFETSRNGQRVTEGIDLENPPSLRVATGAHVRIAAMICKDILDIDRARLVGELGVHLIGVPAMSPTMTEFPAAAHEVIRRSQGVMVVANNPLGWEGERVVHALMSRPTRDDVGRVLRSDVAHPPGLVIGVLQQGWMPFVTVPV
ncbi:MAG: hypothetical protein Q7V88_04975 [Actinomycetota bacterium]|nr:hypothetical protein [Actinomycetota bacterium]